MSVLDRRPGQRSLEERFAAGTVPPALDGPLAGRLLATTVGRGADPVFRAIAAVWLPWLGKTFDGRAGDGRNLFTAGGRRAIRLTMPTYGGLRDEPGGRCSAFRFLTSVGASALDTGVDVLRIDYRDVDENPAWPVRKVLDELVAVDEGRYLGQALLMWRGTLRRAAWFSLEG